MNKKNKPDSRGFVYSTDPNFRFENDDMQEHEAPSPSQQKLKVRLDTKRRAGKTVTIVEGFIGTVNGIEQLCKALKSYCGTGGNVKDFQIIIQGDQREKLLQWLLKNGYKQSKKI